MSFIEAVNKLEKVIENVEQKPKGIIKNEEMKMTMTEEHYEMMTDALNTTAFLMADAEEYIVEKFGKDYAKEHPELLSGFMKAAAIDFNTSRIVNVLENIAAVIREK